LEPSIGSLNLASGLGRNGGNYLWIEVLQNLFPLRDGFTGQEIVFSPEGFSSLDKSKDGVRIDAVGVRKPISEGGQSIRLKYGRRWSLFGSKWHKA
jgi:hypothetical protein